jgi:hypothetical protein
MTVACEHRNGISDSVKGDFFYLRKYYLLEENSTPWNWLVKYNLIKY